MAQNENVETREVPELMDVDLESLDPSNSVAIVFAADYRFDSDLEDQKGAFIAEAQYIAERYSQKAIATWIQKESDGGQKVAVAMTMEERNGDEMCQDFVHHCEYTTSVWRTDVEGLQNLKDELSGKGPEITDELVM